MGSGGIERNLTGDEIQELFAKYGIWVNTGLGRSQMAVIISTITAPTSIQRVYWHFRGNLASHSA